MLKHYKALREKVSFTFRRLHKVFAYYGLQNLLMAPSKWTKREHPCCLSLCGSWSHFCFATAHTYFPSLFPFHLISFPGANLAQTLPLTSGSPSFLLFYSPSTLLILLFLWNIFQWIITKLFYMWLQWECADCQEERREGRDIK